MAGVAVQVDVTVRQRSVLEALVRATSTSQQLAERCRGVLMSAKGQSNVDQAATLGVDRQRVGRWGRRWAASERKLAEAEQEGADGKDLKRLVIEALSDAPRSGTPPKFSAEQVATLIALACEPPGDSGLPVSHWTPPELARELVNRGVVKSISPRQVDLFLRRASSAP